MSERYYRSSSYYVFHEAHVLASHDRIPESFKPVVVIDPEAAGDADLAPLLSIGTVENARDVLRAMLNPTPEEPTDPKARVTDRRENVWRLLADGDWVCTDGPDIGEYLVWWQLAERGPLTVEGVSL